MTPTDIAQALAAGSAVGLAVCAALAVLWAAFERP